MALLTDLIPFSMDDNERGEVVSRNLSYLSAELSADGEEIALKDGTAESIFGANDVIIDAEDVLVGSGNAITREQNGTTGAIHKLGAMVRLKGGTEVATFTFTGSETVTGIRMGANVPGMWQIKINDDWGPPFFTGGLGQEVFFPFSGIQPAENDEVVVVAWTNELSGNFWAWTHR